jgi:transposase-like protein
MTNEPLSRPIVPQVREGHRRKFSENDKRRIVEEAAQPGANLSAVARRFGIAARVLFRWKQELRRFCRSSLHPTRLHKEMARSEHPERIGTVEAVHASPPGVEDRRWPWQAQRQNLSLATAQFRGCTQARRRRGFYSAVTARSFRRRAARLERYTGGESEEFKLLKAAVGRVKYDGLKL